MKLKRYLTEGWRQKQGNTLDHVVMLNDKRNTKSFSLYSYNDESDFVIVIITETDAPNTVKGVKESIVRKKFTDKDKAIKSFKKSVAMAKKKGWKEK